MCCGGDWRGSGSMVHPVYCSREADLLIALAFGPYYFGWILMSNQSSQNSYELKHS